jgi:DNA-binding transcriptional ArsR family regulator
MPDSPVHPVQARTLLALVADSRRGDAYFAPRVQALSARDELRELGLWSPADDQAAPALTLADHIRRTDRSVPLSGYHSVERSLLPMIPDAMLRAAFHPIRLPILDACSEGSHTVSQLSAALGVKPRSLGPHLRILRENDLLVREGRTYRARADWRPIYASTLRMQARNEAASRLRGGRGHARFRRLGTTSRLWDEAAG